jgi:predicted enzyme involved in methoxymalonyl-ACP biosynthesis
MSCRALGRGIEFSFVSRLVSLAFDLGATSVTGRFKRTSKNALCDGFYEKAGFYLVSRGETGEVWKLESLSGGTPPPPAWIAIEGSL